MNISEPTTLLTDYLLAALSAYWGVQLFRHGSGTRQRSVTLWGSALLWAAVAAFLGGTSHGFKDYFDAPAAGLLWKATVYAVGLASFCMLTATLVAATSGLARKWLLTFAGLKLLIYALWMVRHDQFLFVIVDYTVSMLVVLGFQLGALMAGRSGSAIWLATGVVLSFAAAGIQASGLGLHRHFNHNDLYHVVQMLATYLLFRGAWLLKDRAEARGAPPGQAEEPI